MNRKKRNTGKFFPLLFFFGILTLSLCGCQAQKESLKLVDEAIVLFGGEPGEVRALRKLEIAESDGEHLEHYFRQLDEEEKRVYRELLAGILNFQEEIYVTTGKDSVLDRAYDALLLDHEELFWIHGRGVVYKTLYATYGKFRPHYLYTKEEGARVEEEIEAEARELLTGVDLGASDYEKARYVYQAVIQEVSYEENQWDQNVAGVLKEKKAVCAGYARTVQYLLEQLGVECIYVSGEMKGSNQGHAWNMVKLDGDYYYLDATNGDQQAFLPQEEGEPQRVLYDYFCPFPRDYEEICQPDEDFVLPECTAVAYNCYVQSQSCFDTYDTEQLRSYFMNALDAGERSLAVKYTAKEDFETAKTLWIEEEEMQSVAMYYMELTGIHHVQYSYGILEELKTLYFMF